LRADANRANPPPACRSDGDQQAKIRESRHRLADEFGCSFVDQLVEFARARPCDLQSLTADHEDALEASLDRVNLSCKVDLPERESQSLLSVRDR
jgi:hypothetical protein